MFKSARPILAGLILAANGQFAWAQQSTDMPLEGDKSDASLQTIVPAKRLLITPGQDKLPTTRPSVQLPPPEVLGQRSPPQLRDPGFDRLDSSNIDSIKSIDDLPIVNASNGQLIDLAIEAYEIPVGQERLVPTDPSNDDDGAFERDLFKEDGITEQPYDEEQLHELEFGQLDVAETKPLQPASELEAFLADLHVHGYSFAKAEQLGREHFSEAAQKLMDPEYSQIHSGLATVIGLSGISAGEEALWEFIQSGRGPISSQAVNARADAIMSLGYLAASTKGQAGLERLLRAAEPEFWLSEQKVGWTRAEKQEIAQDRAGWLARTALKGLALSGHEKAERLLKGLVGSDRSSFGSDMPEDDELSEWISIAQEIAEIGVVKYTDGS